MDTESGRLSDRTLSLWGQTATSSRSAIFLTPSATLLVLSLPDLSNKTVNLTLGSWLFCPLARLFSVSYT